MRVLLLSDTHIPSRARELPDWVVESLERADHVIHAGDFETPAAYETVARLATELTAVAGNMDGELDLPEVATVDLAGVRFVVTHGTGPLETYDERVAETVAEHADGPTVGVSGHTHQVHDRTVDGNRLLNPGSATGASPASATTVMVATVEDGSCSISTKGTQ